MALLNLTHTCKLGGCCSRSSPPAPLSHAAPKRHSLSPSAALYHGSDLDARNPRPRHLELAKAAPFLRWHRGPSETWRSPSTTAPPRFLTGSSPDRVSRPFHPSRCSLRCRPHQAWPDWRRHRTQRAPPAPRPARPPVPTACCTVKGSGRGRLPPASCCAKDRNLALGKAQGLRKTQVQNTSATGR